MTEVGGAGTSKETVGWLLMIIYNLKGNVMCSYTRGVQQWTKYNLKTFHKKYELIFSPTGHHQSSEQSFSVSASHISVNSKTGGIKISNYKQKL